MENEGAEHLAAIAEARAALADRLITPWWYHPILGLLLASYIVGLSLGNTAIKLVVVVSFAAGLIALASAYRRLTGVWVSGFQAGQAGRWATALGVLMGVIAVAAYEIAYLSDLVWPVWCLAAVVFAGTIVLGRRLDAAVRAQLRAGV